MRAKRIYPLGVEGYESGQWILMDFSDVIVHVMQKSVRDFYDLDGLWSDAENISLDF
jgi:ribosome-associated protein